MENQRKITYEELFAFGANPEHASKLFAQVRILGYARALTGGFVKRVRIFCPKREFGYMYEEMVRLGAYSDRISHQETLHTTYYNGIVMRQILGKLDLKDHEVCMSSSSYHGRAQYFGRELHDLGLVFIPAEAFILGAIPKSDRHMMVDQLCEQYGDGPFVRLCMDDAKGIAERMLAEYHVPPQPQG